MEAVGPAAARHDAAGVLVDDEHLAVLHHVVAVALVERVRAQRLLHVVQRLELLRGVEVVDLQARLQLLDACVGERHRAALLVELVVLLGEQAVDDLVDLPVEVGVVVGGAGDDERGARLIDEDGVGLVDDGEVELALHVVLQTELHVVAQVVVGDVGAVAVLPLLVGQVVEDAAGGHAEVAVDAAHPLGVAAGEVVVHRHHVHAAARQRVEVAGQGGGERLAFTGAHLGDAALVEEHAADHLHVVVPLAQHAPARLAGHGEGLEEHVIERLAVGHFLLEARGLAREVLVFQRPHLRFQLVDAGDLRQRLAQLAVILGADDFLQNPFNHW